MVPTLRRPTPRQRPRRRVFPVSSPDRPAVHGNCGQLCGPAWEMARQAAPTLGVKRIAAEWGRPRRIFLPRFRCPKSQQHPVHRNCGQLCGTNGGSARQAAPMLDVKRCAAESGSGHLSFFHHVPAAPPRQFCCLFVLAPTGQNIGRKSLVPPSDDVVDRPQAGVNYVSFRARQRTLTLPTAVRSRSIRRSTSSAWQTSTRSRRQSRTSLALISSSRGSWSERCRRTQALVCESSRSTRRADPLAAVRHFRSLPIDGFQEGWQPWL